MKINGTDIDVASGETMIILVDSNGKEFGLIIKEL